MQNPSRGGPVAASAIRVSQSKRTTVESEVNFRDLQGRGRGPLLESETFDLVPAGRRRRHPALGAEANRIFKIC
jgi:hypothetical protein